MTKYGLHVQTYMEFKVPTESIDVMKQEITSNNASLLTILWLMIKNTILISMLQANIIIFPLIITLSMLNQEIKNYKEY